MLYRVTMHLTIFYIAEDFKSLYGLVFIYLFISQEQNFKQKQEIKDGFVTDYGIFGELISK